MFLFDILLTINNIDTTWQRLEAFGIFANQLSVDVVNLSVGWHQLSVSINDQVFDTCSLAIVAIYVATVYHLQHDRFGTCLCVAETLQITTEAIQCTTLADEVLECTILITDEAIACLYDHIIAIA